MDLKLQEHMWVGPMGYLHAGSSEIIGCLQEILFEKKPKVKQKHPLAFILIFRGPAEGKAQKKRRMRRNSEGRKTTKEKLFFPKCKDEI